MIQQSNNRNIRKQPSTSGDIPYLTEYYKKNGTFPVFQQVLIETRTDCNNHCPFCPHNFQRKKLNVMTWDCYCKIIDDLVEMDYNGRIALMISNEPLLDERLPEMIKYARAKSPRLFLDITTNGTLLSLEKVDYLLAIGLDNININDYRGDRALNPDKISSNLIPIVSAYSNNPKITLQKRSFSEKWPNYGGNIPQEFESTEYGFCNFPFRKLTIAYNGDVVLCCDDFMYATSFGNVMTRRLIDCWNDSAFNDYRMALLNNERIGLCQRCNDHQDYSVFA